ncbi:hypothetical protein AQUCO_00200731v1 [Aquilegia coerulea]|uniref:F-box associated domain-containing protein n=1 Tax=Aquilegia coerulea TaxID=218851 RepID=A0A2G5F4W0_AQUCA|nr:hypothetical protein AQUCO_00200731v1 [Aquilegia coerulea]
MPNTSKWVCTYALDFLDDNLICFNDPASYEFIPNKVCNYNRNQHFDIWVLHGYGTKESWSKLYTIGPFDIVMPQKLLNEREFLLVSNSISLYLYNLVTQEMQDFDYMDSHPLLAFVIYNESLVSIKGKGAADRETSLRQFARICGDNVESEEEEEEMNEERVESQSEEESEEDGEIKDLENKISNEVDLGLKLGFEPSSSK